MIRNLNDLAVEVGEWSDRNFGDKSGAFQSLSGISEEIRELRIATELWDEESILDAYADAIIYFANFCYETNIILPNGVDDFHAPSYTYANGTDIRDAAESLHARHLKFYQGIRNVTLDVVNGEAQTFWLRIKRHFHVHFPTRDLKTVVLDVWSKVSKRDWVNDPVNGTAAVQKEVKLVQQELPFTD